MTTAKYQTKDDLIKTIVKRQKDVLANKDVESGLIDAIVPLSAMDGKIKSINDDGTITVEFTAPILGYLDYLTKKKLHAIIDMLDEVAPEK